MKKAIFLFSVITLSMMFAADPELSCAISASSTISPGDLITGIDVNPQTGMAMAISSEGGSLYIIDGSKSAISRKVALGSRPALILAGTTGNTALVCSQDGTLSSVDLQSGSLEEKVKIGKRIFSAAIDRKYDSLVMGSENGLVFVDISSGRISREIALSSRIEKVAVVKDVAIVAGARSLWSVDLATGTVLKQVQLPERIGGLAVDAAAGTIVLTMENRSAVYLYDTELSLSAEIPVCNSSAGPCTPVEVAVNPSTHVAVATDTANNRVYVIDLAGKKLKGTLSARIAPSHVAIDASWNMAYIAYGSGIALERLENPTPILDCLVPQTVKSGTPGLDLVIEGSRFLRDSQAQFNSKDVTTGYGSNEQLRVGIDADSLAVPGEFPVTVTNPSPGGGVSNSLTFKVFNLVPTIENISPENVSVGTLATLRVSGRNFFNGSTIVVNGVSLRTRFISSILLEAELRPQDVRETGRYPVAVINPVPDNFSSGPAYLGVLSPDDSLLQKATDSVTARKALSLGTGSLYGRIVNTQSKPVQGVTIKIRNRSTRTDANGMFLLENVPAGKNVLLMDGSTALDKEGRYPTIPLAVQIQPNVMNRMPFQPYLHRQKNRNFKSIEHNRAHLLRGEEAPRIGSNGDLVVTDPEMPGVELKIPNGVKITGWDGKPNLKVSMRTVPTDRLPVKPLPDNAFARTVNMFYFDKVGGGVPDRPIPFRAPNDLGLMPGEKAILWYYDESPNEDEAPNDWAIAGTGTVSADGRFIDSDPGVGIPKFCCGAAAYGGSSLSSPPSAPEGANDQSCSLSAKPSSYAGDPVDVTNGYFFYKKVDYRVPGAIPIEVVRYYRSGDAGYSIFGLGTFFSYDWWLQESADMLLLLMPGNFQVRYAKQVDGTFTNSTDPAFSGDVFRKNTDGSYVLQKKNGWSYKFSSQKLLVETRDNNGNVLTVLREINSNVSKIITPEGKSISFDIVINPGRDNATKITGPYGTVTYNYVMGYGATGQLRSVNYPDGSTTGYEYDSSNRMTKITENGKLVVENLYDANNRVIKQTHGDGGVFNYAYTVAGGLVTQTSMTEPNGAVSTWRFNSARYITEVTTPDGTTTYEREPGTNRVLSVTDPLDRRESYVYDARGRVSSITSNAGNVTRYEYEDNFDKIARITDALGNVSTFEYDAKGNLIRSTSPTGEAVTTTYNDRGKPLTTTDSLSRQVRMLYDDSGKLTTIIDPAGHSERIEYDQLDRVSRVINAKGSPTDYAYDSSNRVKSVTNAIGGTTQFIYDLDGNLNQLLDAKNRSVRYEYDVRNRVIKATDPLGKYSTFAYDTSDNLISAKDRKGNTTTYTYDSMKRLTGITYSDSSTVSYQHDAAGRPTSITDSQSGTISYTYVNDGCSTCGGGHDLVSQVTTPQGTISYTYDALGRRRTMTVQGRPPVSYNYDASGRLAAMSTTSSSQGELNFAVTRDGVGRPTTLIHNGGATGYEFSNTDRLLSMTHNNAASATVESLSYAYDSIGNIASMSRPGVALPFPKSVSNAIFDAANRMLTFQPIEGTEKNITYDDNGNMTSITDSCGTTSYTWDARNQLVGISGYKPDCTALSASFSYDALGRRIQKTVNGKSSTYLYDGQDIVREVDGGGGSADYIRTLNIDDPLARIKSDGTIRHYLKDALGSVIALADETGAVKTRYAYDPFGNTTVSGEESDNPFQYTGRENDGTGLYYYRARYYSPELQRFVSEDPIGLAGGDVNLYGHVLNDPVNFVDPLGLQRYKLTKPEIHPGSKEHIHWGRDVNGRDGGAVNKDGTCRHGAKPPRKVVDLIEEVFGWDLNMLKSLYPFLMLPGAEVMFNNLRNGLPLDFNNYDKNGMPIL